MNASSYITGSFIERAQISLHLLFKVLLILSKVTRGKDKRKLDVILSFLMTISTYTLKMETLTEVLGSKIIL